MKTNNPEKYNHLTGTYLSLVAHGTIGKAFQNILKDFLVFLKIKHVIHEIGSDGNTQGMGGLQYIPEDYYFESTEPKD